MDKKIIFERDSSNINKSYHLKNNVFLLYTPRNQKNQLRGKFQEFFQEVTKNKQFHQQIYALHQILLLQFLPLSISLKNQNL